MITNQDIDQFYKDVELLGLKFPVAEIAKATGQPKSNVSKYLSRKLEPSETFLKKYYEKFPKSDKNVSRGTLSPDSGTNSPQSDKHVTVIFNLTESQLNNLTETTRDQASGIKIQAEANKIDAQNYQALISNLNSDADKRTLEASVKMIQGLRKYIIELASHIKKVKPIEIEQALNNKVREAAGMARKTDTLFDGDS